MKPKTETILGLLWYLTLSAVVGYAFTFGGQAISFGVSFNNPVAADRMPGINQDLQPLLRYNFQYYTYIMSFVLVLSAMLIYVWLQVLQLLSKVNLQNPFTFEVAKRLETIAYWLVSVWLISVIGMGYSDWVSQRMGVPLNIFPAAKEYFFFAGIVYIISQIFKHGIEIQEENLQTI